MPGGMVLSFLTFSRLHLLDFFINLTNKEKLVAWQTLKVPFGICTDIIPAFPTWSGFVFLLSK